MALFDAIDQAVGIRSGALLLPDHTDSVFAPWVARGIGATTAHRLRPPFELFRANEVEGLIDPQLLAPYVSLHARDTLEEAVVIPLIYDETVHGVLAVFESPYSTFDREKLELMLASVADRCAILLMRTRSNLFASMKQVVLLDDEKFFEAGAHLLEQAKQTRMILNCVLLDYKNATEALSERYPGLNRRRARKDIEAVLTAMFAGLAALTCRPGDRIGALMLQSRAVDSELLQRQLTAQLDKLFPTLEDRDAIEITCFTNKLADEQFLPRLRQELT